MNALINRYKVLATMIALDKFTTSDLSIISGVDLEQVEPLVYELKNNDSIKKIPPRRSSGQKTFFQIIPEKTQSLKAELNEMFKTAVISRVQNRPPDPPLSLLIADNILSLGIPSTKEIDRKKELLELTLLNIETARAEMGLTSIRDKGTTRQTERSADLRRSKPIDQYFQSVFTHFEKIFIELNKSIPQKHSISAFTQDKLIKQVLGVQKSTLSIWVNIVTICQDQTALTVDMVCKQASWIPEEGRRVISSWADACKKERDRFRYIIEEEASEFEKMIGNSKLRRS